MKKIILASAVAMAMSTSVMAEDFRALGSIQAAPVQNMELAATEGGATCDAVGADTAGAGVALCSYLSSAAGGQNIFTVVNELPVTSASFLSVVGF